MRVFQSVPMWRFTERMVRSTFVTACRLATSPTSTSPFLAKATTEGVVRAPSALAMTVGSPPSSTATTEFVVPRSIPTARAMVLPPVAGRPVRGRRRCRVFVVELGATLTCCLHSGRQVEPVQLNSCHGGQRSTGVTLFPDREGKCPAAAASRFSADDDSDGVRGAPAVLVQHPEAVRPDPSGEDVGPERAAAH